MASDRPFNVLFLGTGNTARSVLNDSILRKDGAGPFNAFSAGSHPKGMVNPFALMVLRSYGYPAEGFRSKSWDEFAAGRGSSIAPPEPASPHNRQSECAHRAASTQRS
jgi:protein-tyrosine-phosphatase